MHPKPNQTDVKQPKELANDVHDLFDSGRAIEVKANLGFVERV